MMKKMVVLLAAGCVALTACSSLNRSASDKETSLSALIVETTSEPVAEETTAEAHSEQSSEITEQTEETFEHMTETEQWEGEEESGNKESGTGEPAAAIETNASSAAELDLESAFELAGIAVEKIDRGYLLTYPAGTLGDLTIEEMRESFGSEDIIISNEDGSVTFRLTDDEFSYMAESFNRSRSSTAQ